MSKEEKNWKKIASTIHVPQAVSWRDILNEANIVSLVDPPTNHIDPYPTTSLAVELGLFVRPQDEEKAREILGDMSLPVDEEEE